MATIIGTTKADHVAVSVNERAEVVRITQDNDASIEVIILCGMASLSALIDKLEIARQMINDTHQVAV